MEITRKNYELRVNGLLIKRFSFCNCQYDYSLLDVALIVAKETIEDVKIDWEETRDGNLWLSFNGALAVQLTKNGVDDDYYVSFLHLNISRKSTKETVLNAIQELIKACEVAYKTMISQDFEIEIKVSSKN